MTGNTEHHNENETISSDDSRQPGRHRPDTSMKRRRVLIGGTAVAAAGGLAVAGFASADTTDGTASSAEAAAEASSGTSTTSGVCTLNAEVIHTGQLFFDPDINEEIQATSPYSANTTKETALADDSIYDDGGASSGLLTLTALGSGVSDGYRATITVGVDSA
ncbi:hypothetical protein OHU34_28990 [Streptomyces sp. NBC_00080]|uniref:hypothetical protein n=1 Tax=Streptomyces TaxID=1883 RepID=UPI0011529230|nr:MULTISPECIES: hypothetical protein [Streptomyces]